MALDLHFTSIMLTLFSINPVFTPFFLNNYEVPSILQLCNPTNTEKYHPATSENL
jgi:hypothetical protein